MILEEFDEDRRAIIDPAALIRPVENMPKTAVTCFAFATFQRMVEALGAELMPQVRLANMGVPVYRAVYKEKELTLFLSAMGAPACAAVLEEMFALGVERVVMFGTCGVLDSRIEDCSVIVPHSAVRDEGTSFHYAPPSDEIEVNVKYRREFTAVLNEFQCKYMEGKVWTTDAFYRETCAKAARRRQQGCVCVDMECSAAAAVAQFRGKELFHFFYAADNLDSDVWDARSLGNLARLKDKDAFALLALELAARIS